jgi:hypothetical protein
MQNDSTTLTPTTAQSGSFPPTDVGGTWALVDGNSSVVVYGSLAISTADVVTGGNWTEIGVTSGTFTGGTVSADSHGTISGTLSTSVGTTHILSDGQMSLDKDLFIFAGTGNEAGIALRVNSSYATADLAGTWSWVGLNSYGTIEVNTTGTITGGTYTLVGGSSGIITSGTLAITDQGTISGSFTTSEPIRLTIQNGQMNSDKNVLYLACTSAPTLGNGVIIAIQQGGSFTPGTDMAGIYQYISITSYDSVAYGSITVDGAGVVTGGNWTEIGVGSGTVTGGTLALSTQGVMTGSVSISGGNMHVLQSGQMNSSKTVAITVDRDNAAHTEMTVLVRAPLSL